MQTFVLCLEVRDGKQAMRGSWSDRVEGWREGGREMSMSPLFSPSPSSSLQSSLDRKSLIGNEPWSRSLSRDQQIATPYRLWRGASSPSSHRYLALILPLLPLSSSLSPVFMKSLWFIQGRVEVRAAESRGSISPLPTCQTAPLTGVRPRLHWRIRTD